MRLRATRWSRRYRAMVTALEGGTLTFEGRVHGIVRGRTPVERFAEAACAGVPRGERAASAAEAVLGG
ncbi:hypothetical protein AB3662_05670 [Sorangium cellulosum]|uniref:hypothetical protein n=1 Tax=Sorangium cellulosum TaxID=56 RepID=UPI003D9A5874